MKVQEMFWEIKKRICEIVHERNGSKETCKNQIESCLQLIRLCDVARIMNQVESEYETKTDWIPCEERLPDDDEDVLVQMEDDSMMVDFRTASSSGWFWAEESELPIAWQPLPQPYKKEGNSNADT